MILGPDSWGHDRRFYAISRSPENGQDGREKQEAGIPRRSAVRKPAPSTAARCGVSGKTLWQDTARVAAGLRKPHHARCRCRAGRRRYNGELTPELPIHSHVVVGRCGEPPRLGSVEGSTRLQRKEPDITRFPDNSANPCSRSRGDLCADPRRSRTALRLLAAARPDHIRRPSAPVSHRFSRAPRKARSRPPVFSATILQLCDLAITCGFSPCMSMTKSTTRS